MSVGSTTSPTIKPYDQVAWATLPDTRAAPPEASLDLLQGLHTRWVAVLRTLDETSLQRKRHHPEDGMLTVSRIIQSYAWHGRHHRAHIANLRSRMGGARIATDTDYSGRPIIRPKFTDRPPPRRPRRRCLVIRHTSDGIRVAKTADGWYTIDENLELGAPVDDPKFGR